MCVVLLPPWNTKHFEAFWPTIETSYVEKKFFIAEPGHIV